MKLVIFGTGQIAELAAFYFSLDTNYSVVGFCVDRDYLSLESFQGKPVVPADEVEKHFPPSSHVAFVALSYARINRLRADKYHLMKEKGYRLASYISPRASVFDNVHIGDNCFILEDCTVQPFVTLGNDVILWSGSHIGHHSMIGDHCFVAPHVAVSGGCRLGAHSFIGVNATLRNGLTLGERCVVGAGALVLNDANDESVFSVRGNERSREPSSRLRNI